MDETPPINDEIKQTPPAEENNLAAQAAAETPAETASAFPPESAKPQKSNKPLIAIVAIILVALIGVGAWAVLSNKQSEPIPRGEPTPEAPVDEPEEEETEITDEAIISSLFEKLLILHQPNVNNYLSYAGDNYVKNQRLSFGSVYTVSGDLYTDGLTENDKFFIITQYMSDNGDAKLASELSVPSDFYASKFANYCATTPEDTMCSKNEGKAISEEAIAEVYEKIFGEAPATFEQPTGICGAYAYDSAYHIYYDGIHGCGGADGPEHQVYIDRYTESESYAYAYLRVATINLYDGENVPVYKTYFGMDDLYDRKTNQYLTPDESLIYTRLGNGGMGMDLPQIINANNASEFDQYRFVFKKDGENYYFNTVEKL